MRFYACDVYLVDQQTGDTTVYRCEHCSDDEDGAFAEFIWSDGNYACDCNRAAMIAHARGLPVPDDRPCTSSRYRIEKIVRLSDGVVVYHEDVTRQPRQ